LTGPPHRASLCCHGSCAFGRNESHVRLVSFFRLGRFCFSSSSFGGVLGRELLCPLVRRQDPRRCDALLQVSSRESSFQFLFNHLTILSLLCGILAGVVTAQYRHGAMKWVWVVPTLILGYRFITYPSTLFQDHFAAAFHHYLSAGFLIPEFHTYGEMFGAWVLD